MYWLESLTEQWKREGRDSCLRPRQNDVFDDWRWFRLLQLLEWLLPSSQIYAFHEKTSWMTPNQCFTSVLLCKFLRKMKERRRVNDLLGFVNAIFQRWKKAETVDMKVSELLHRWRIVVENLYFTLYPRFNSCTGWKVSLNNEREREETLVWDRAKMMFSMIEDDLD